MMAATSGDFLGDSEHAAKDPIESRAAKLKHRFIVFIFFLLVTIGDTKQLLFRIVICHSD
jgi:hypothetical protein